MGTADFWNQKSAGNEFTIHKIKLLQYYRLLLLLLKDYYNVQIYNSYEYIILESRLDL